MSQVQYVGLNAYAPVLVYLEIEKLKDPVRRPAPTALPSGTQVGEEASNGGQKALQYST